MATTRPRDIGFISTSAPHWREFRETYPRIATCLALTITVLLLTDFFLIFKGIALRREQAVLDATTAQTEIRRAAAVDATKHDLLATAAGAARRETLLARELHLAVDCDGGVMYLKRDGVVLREMPIRLSRESTSGTRPGSSLAALRRGRYGVVRVVEASNRREKSGSTTFRVGPAQADTARSGESGPVEIILDHGARIYSRPETGPLVDTNLPPGSVRAETADLEAIKADLQPGMKVYFY